MSEIESDTITRESLRIGTGDLFACYVCGIPKRESEFEGSSVLCRICAARHIAAKNTEVTGEDLRKTKFDVALDQLRNSQEPAVPGGVRKAHEILGGKTSSELLAEVASELRDGKGIDGKPTWIQRDGKLYTRTLELLQRAEFKHDDALKKQDPASILSYDEVRSLSLDTIVQEMIRDRELRMKVLGILYERCPDLINDMMNVANITIIPPAISDLELGDVI